MYGQLRIVTFDTAGTDGGGDTAPVGIFSEKCCFDQQRIAQGSGGTLRLPIVCRTPDFESDQLVGTLAVFQDQHCHFECDLLEGCPERLFIINAALSIGKQHHCVVGRGIAIDGDTIEGAGSSPLQHWMHRFGRYGSICDDKAEHCRHRGIDHPCTFADRGDMKGFAAPELHTVAEFFFETVGGHNGTGCLVAFSGLIIEAVEGRADLFSVESIADDACGAHHRVGEGDAPAQFGKEKIDILDPLLACHCVGIFGVDEKKIALKPFGIAQVVPDGGGTETVGSEDGGNITGGIAADEGDITIYGTIFSGIGRVGAHTDIDSITIKAGHIFQSVFDREQFKHISTPRVSLFSG